MKRAFMDGYRHYDPGREGYGSARQWRREFNATMGMDEARRRVGRDSPEAILGLSPGAAWADVRTAYRQLARDCHPDRCAIHGLPVDVATERFKRLIAAFTVLEARHAARPGGRR